MAELCYFPDDLHNRLAALEAAAERYEPGEFRDGVAFALGLVRVSLGLMTTLTIPIRKEMTTGYKMLAEEERGEVRT